MALNSSELSWSHLFIISFVMYTLFNILIQCQSLSLDCGPIFPANKNFGHLSVFSSRMWI